MLEDLEFQLETAYNDVGNPPIVRVAAKAALLVVGKYYQKATEDCWVLILAVGTCLHSNIFSC